MNNLSDNEAANGEAVSYCIFCDSVTGPDTTAEHIMHDCLGGRETTSGVLCSRHNNLFGGTIDNAFAAPLLPIRNLMQFKSGSGKPPPMLRGLQAGKDRIHVSGTGEVQLADPPITFSDGSDGLSEARITTADPATIKKLIPHIAARYGVTVEDVEKQIDNVTLVERRPDGAVNFELGFGTAEALRSMLKSCLVLLARHVGNDVVRDEKFKAARNFVLNGGEQFQIARIRLDTRDLPGTPKLTEQFSQFFSLIYVKSNGDGRVIGHFTIYNMIGWRFILCERGGPKHCRFAVANNPDDPAVRSRDASELPDITFDWLDADSEVTLDRMQKRLIEMDTAYRNRAIPSEFDRIVDDTIAQSGLKPGDELSEEFIGRLADRSARFKMRLPYQEALSPDEVAKLLTGKQPR